jgi:hypothetical protein
MTGTRPLRAVYAHDPETNGTAESQAPGEPVDGATALAARRLAPNREELGAVIDEFMQAAEEGEAEDGYGQYYTPEGLRELHSALSHVKSELGTMNVRAIGRWHVQGMLDELRRAGLAPGRLTAVVEALHGLYSYAIERGLVDDSPVIFLTFPQQVERAETVRAPAIQRPAPVPEPEYQLEAAPTPTPTGAMIALGGRVLLWTMRATVTVFVLVAIVLVVEFA